MTEAQQSISTKEGAIVEREDIKDRLPRAWHNEMRFVRLANGMRVVLSSTKGMGMTSGTMVVRCGLSMDPPDIPGLAHLCEHMLFLGTRKYPGENSFPQFLRSRGGDFAGGTLPDRTSFSFQVPDEFFEDALDHFAQFFTEPLFAESAIEREINVIDSEFENERFKDQCHVNAVLQTASVPGHPYAKFATGCRATFTARPLPELREALVRLFDTYYSPQGMVLALDAPYSLDKLEQLVVKYFSSIPVRSGADGHGTPIEVPLEDVVLPFPKDEHGHTHLLLRQVPVTNYHEVSVLWQIPGDLCKDWREEPARNITHLLGYQSDGSVLSLLKTRGWAVWLDSDVENEFQSFYIVKCTVGLTFQGFVHWKDVVAVIYAYLGMLCAQEPSRAHFDELHVMGELRYASTPRASGFESKSSPLASRLFNGFPIQQLLSSSASFTKFDPDKIKSVLAQMSPNNAVTLLIAPELDPECTDTEQWYGVHFSHAQQVPDTLNARWMHAYHGGDFSGALHIPDKNPLIPSLEGCVMVGPVDKESCMTEPVCVYEDEQCTCFWKDGSMSEVPRLYSHILLSNKHTQSTLEERCCAAIFVRAFAETISSFNYMAKLAGIHGAVNDNQHGLDIDVYGYSEKVKQYTEQLLKKFQAFQPSRHLFERAKRSFYGTVSSWRCKPPRQQLHDLIEYSRSHDPFFPYPAFENVVLSITFKDLQEWMKTFFQSGVRIVALYEGNITEEGATELVKLVKNTLKLPVAPPEELPKNAAWEVPLGTTIQDILRIGDDTNNAVVVIRSNRLRDTSIPDINLIYAMLTETLIKNKFYDMLRTQQQVGYHVDALFFNRSWDEGFRFTIQSSTHTPDDIYKRINDFLVETPKMAEALTDEQFSDILNTLTRLIVDSKRYLEDDFDCNWISIVNGHHSFDDCRHLGELCRECTKDGLVNYITTHLVPGGSKEHEFTMRLWGQFKNQEELDAARENTPSIPAIHFTSAEEIVMHDLFKPKFFFNKVLRV